MINRALRRRTSSFIRGSRTLVWPHKCGEDGGILREPRAYEPVGFVRSVVVPVNSKSIYRGSHWQRERRADGWSFQCYIVISGTITIPSITIYGPNHSLAPSAQEISSAVPDQSNSSFLPMLYTPLPTSSLSYGDFPTKNYLIPN